MRFFRLLLMFLLGLCVQSTVHAQRKQDPYAGIVNGRANYLPIPTYSIEASLYCATGKVEIEVLIGEDGNVLAAKAVSGDELLFDSSIAAAKAARFSPVSDGVPVKVRGKLVYNFDSYSKCLKAEVVNKMALRKPKPILGDHIKFDKEIDVTVRIVVNMDGKVVRARTVGNVGLQIKLAVEQAALATTFSYTNDVSRDVYVSASLVYKFKKDGTIDY